MRRITKIEGGVYTCTWRRTLREWILAVQSPVTMRVKAGTLEEAKDRLNSELMHLIGDGEPHLEFIPPLPDVKAESYFTPEYFEIVYNDSVTWRCAEPETLYSGGICKKCGIGIGTRTTARRTITSIPRFDVSGFYRDRNLSIMISTDCLGHLRRHLKGRATFVPVEVDNRIRSKIRKSYFELAFEPELSVVVPRGWETASGWQCRKCGVFSVQWTTSRVQEVVSGVNREQVRSPILLFKSGPRYGIGIGRRIRDKIIKDAAVRGFSSGRVAMFDANEIMSVKEIRDLRLRQISI